MASFKKEFIFLQTQEMFPQLEADVVYMILSENEFKINDALQSLTILSGDINSNASAGSNGTDSCFNNKEETQANNSNGCITVEDKTIGLSLGENFSVYNSHYQEMENLSQFSALTTSLENSSSHPSQLHSVQTKQQYPAFVSKEDGSVCRFNSAAWNCSLTTSIKSHTDDDYLDADSVEEIINTKFKDKSNTKFVNTLSYIGVGKLNGVRLQFFGNGQHIPNIINQTECLQDSTKLFHNYKRITTTLHPILFTLPESKNLSYSGSQESLLTSSSWNKVESNCRTSNYGQNFTHTVEHSEHFASDNINSETTSISALQNFNTLPDETFLQSAKELSNHLPTSVTLHRETECIGNAFEVEVHDNPPTLQRTCTSIDTPFPSLASPNLVDTVNMSNFYRNGNYPYNNASHGFPSRPSYHGFRMYQPPGLSPSRNTAWVSGQRDFNSSVHRSPIAATPKNQSRKNAQFSKSINEANVEKHNNGKVMHILRGAPGSGKSTLAFQICGSNGIVLSTDDFFVTPRGGYVFNRYMLSEAHEWNQQRAEDCLKQGKTPVVIDNTNMTAWEMKPYMLSAVNNGYEIKISEPNTWWKFKPSQLATRNSHGVPKESIENMLSRYENNVTVKSVLGDKLFQKYQKNCIRRTSANCSLSKHTPKRQQTKTGPSQKGFSTISELQSNNYPQNTNKGDTVKQVLQSMTPESSTAQNNFEHKRTNIFPNTSSNIVEVPIEASVGKASSTPTTHKIKVKKHTPSFKPHFSEDTLRDFDHNWSSLISFDKTDTNVNKRNQNVKQSSMLPTSSVVALTSEDDFILLHKVETDSCTDVKEKIVCGNSARFQPSKHPEQTTNTKLTFAKSTSTADLEQDCDESQDVETLKLLFPDYTPHDLLEIYQKCDKQLQWTTDVIAESSLFGMHTNEGLDHSNSSRNLDDYYDSVIANEECNSPGQVTNEEHFNLETSSSEEGIQLHLTQDFLQAINSLFGDNKTITIDAGCTINIGTKLANEIYQIWKETSNATKVGSKDVDKTTAKLSPAKASYKISLAELFSTPKSQKEIEQLKKDEALARRLQAEENTPSRPSTSDQSISRTSLLNTDHSIQSPGQWLVGKYDDRRTLTEIMNEEETAAESEKRQSSKLNNIKLASQLKREELHAMYSSVPTPLLDDIFAANDFNLEETMFAVNCIFCDDYDLFSTTTTVSGSLNLSMKQKAGSSKILLGKNNTQFSKDPSKKTDLTHDDVCSDVAITYDDIRAEANLQRNQMHDCQKKASIAYHQKKGALAMYYGQQAYEHQKRLREANQRAAAITYKRLNEGRSPNELDLHGLHVDEAIDTLRSVIEQRRSEPNSFRHLYVITGRGLNSALGIPKIKNAIMEWLKNKEIPFELINEGYLKINL